MKKRYKGKIHGLSVRDTWAHLFTKNEHYFEADDATPLTDAQIALEIAREFPHATAVSASRIRSYRNQFNNGTYVFKALGPAKKKSYEYDTNGKRIEQKVKSSPTTVVVEHKIDDDAIREIVRSELKAQARPILNITFPEGSVKQVDTNGKHVKLQAVLQRVSAGLPVLLVGPTGSGKTHLASQVAEALDSSFTFNSMSEGVSEAHLFGRVLPDSKGTWKYRPSPFVNTWQKGGVHLLDEIDGADPNLLVAINAALANGLLSLPFADVKPFARHKDCIIISAANTYGLGADRQYVGRNQLDAATLDRFKIGTVEIDYDQALERAIVAGILDNENAERVLKWGWGVRDAIQACGLRRTLSTRNLKDIAALMTTGVTFDECKAIYCQGWSKDERAKVGA